MLKVKEKGLNQETLSKYKFEYFTTLQEYKREFKSEGIALIVDETTRNIYFRQLKSNAFPEMKSLEIFYEMVKDDIIEDKVLDKQNLSFEKIN